MDVNTTIQTWSNILVHPGEAAFNEERDQPQATLSTALIWMVVAAIASGVLGWLQLRLFVSRGEMSELLDQMNLPPEMAAEMDAIFSGEAFGVLAGSSGLIAIILTPIFFLIGTGILHWIALLLGGSGQFGRFAYLMAAIQAPIAILNAVAGFIPVLGGCLSLAMNIYSIVLTFFALKTEHILSDGRAIGALLVPLALLLFLFICGVAALAGLFMAIPQ